MSDKPDALLDRFYFWLAKRMPRRLLRHCVGQVWAITAEENYQNNALEVKVMDMLCDFKVSE